MTLKLLPISLSHSIITVSLFLCNALSAQSWNWAQGYELYSLTFSQMMEVDQHGNIYCTGNYNDTVILGNDTLPYQNNTEIFVAKFDSVGVPIWARGYPGIGTSQGNGIALDEVGNSYVVGYTGVSNLQIGGTTLSDEGPVIIKHDTAGNVVWAQALGFGSLSQAFDIHAALDGYFYITGWSYGSQFGSIPFTSTGNSDAFLTKMDTAGQFHWVRRIVGGTFGQRGQSIAVDSAQNVFVTGEAIGDLAFEGDTINNVGFGDRMFIVKYDSTGNFQWARGAPGPYVSNGLSIATDPFGNAYAAGTFEDTMYIADDTIVAPFGNIDIYILKFSPEGKLLWHEEAGSTVGGESPNSMKCDSSGNLYLVGSPGGTTNKYFDTITYSQFNHFIVKYTALGNAHWIHGTTSSGGTFRDIHLADHKAILSGHYDFYNYQTSGGSQSLPNYAGGNFFLMLTELALPPCPTIIPNFTVNCLSDSTVELVADAGYVNYKWSDGQFGQSIEVSNSGSYYMVVVDSSNCTGTSAPQNVEVSPSPIVNASGPLEFCVGGSATLSADSAFINYQWSTGDTSQSIVLANSDTIIVTVTDSLGCIKVSEEVIVIMHDPQPVIVLSGSTDLCEGESVTLSTQQSYDSYAWTGGSTGSSITISQAGTYNVTVTEGPGCTASATAVNVTVTDSTITITADDPLEFCDGDDVTLSTTVTNISQYDWSTGATTPTVTITQSESVSLSVVFNNGCQANSNTLDVTVYPNPAPPVINLNGLDQLNTTGGFVFYQWLIEGQEIAGATDTSYIADASGSYTVVVTDSNGCQSVSEAFEYALGIDQLQSENGIVVYPNPGKGHFTVVMNQGFPKGEFFIKVTDIAGRTLLEKSIERNSKAFEFSIEGQPKGVYNLQVIAEGVVHNVSLVVE